MDIFFEISFWLSIALLFHSYVLFPVILHFSAKNKKENTEVYKEKDEFPHISIINSSHNEEKYIEQKIISVLETDYPKDKIEFIAGSDNSSDKTNLIIEKYAKKYPQIKFYPFRERQGKIKIINKLVKEAENDILILTDTKVFFRKNTLFHLVKHFKNPEIKVVGGILKNKKQNPEDISVQEDTYMNNEMKLKYNEGIAGKCSMGVFGAVYAIRKENMPEIPENFIVDDFFVTMKNIKEGNAVIFDRNAVADEEITGSFKEEYKRKTRIAAGNFQNLKEFLPVLKNPFTKKAFYFFSHKIIRWTGPFLIVAAFISDLFLLHRIFYRIAFALFLISIVFVLFDFILKNKGINIKIFRYFTHFYGMNTALAAGFLRYIRGIKSSIWEPSKR